MTLEQGALLVTLAAKYIWWKKPADAVRFPDRVIAQIMDLGDYDDACRLLKVFGEAYLQRVLHDSEAGELSPRSWAYWHYRLHLVPPLQVPPMPQRKVA